MKCVLYIAMFWRSRPIGIIFKSEFSFSNFRWNSYMETRTQSRSSQIQTHHHAWPRQASVVSWCPDMLLVRQILIFMCQINCLLHILHFISFFEPPPYLLVKFIEHRTRFLILPKLTEFLCRKPPLWKSYFCARFAFNWRQSVSSFEVRLKSTGFDRIVFDLID